MARLDGLDTLKSFLSPYTGVVRHVHERIGGPDDARMSVITAEMAPGATLTIGSPHDLTAGASNYDREAALAGALGEALERYSGTILPESELVLATASDLGPKAVPPERFTLFSEDQYAQDDFPFEPFTSDTPVRWVKGWSIPDGAEAYLPQQLVYIEGPASKVPGEATVGWGSSNGMALALTHEGAVLGGLLELIERDAIMLTWASRVSLPRLDWSADPELVEMEKRHFAPTGLPYEVIDASVFCDVPTALAIQRSGNDDPARFAMGASSAPTMREAWDKALRECFQIRPLIRSRLLEDPGLTYRADFADLQAPEDHALLYVMHPEYEGELAFIDSSEDVRDIRDVPDIEGDDPSAQIESIARRLEAKGLSAYAVDITAPDVRAAGLHVVHVISPELQPIDFIYSQRFLGGKRLYEAAHQLGLLDAPLSADQMNPYPHPFP